MRKGVYNIGASVDRYLVPRVQYAAHRLRNDVAPSIGSAIVNIGNQAAIATAETVQQGAQVFKNKILPAIEDRFVELANAAVPEINKGIDVIESGFEASMNMLSKSTAKGINRISSKVLGEQRHNRVKTIANNLSGGLNNGINSIASALSSIGTGSGDSRDAIDYDNYNYDTNNYNNIPEYDYPPQQHNNNKKKNTGNTVVRNAAYSISKHILGENLTHAVAPLASTLTKTVEEALPSVVLEDDKIVIDLPGDDTERKEKLRDCTTPYGAPGLCRDLSDCPDLILDLGNLRKSICFKSFFVPGVCCPGNDEKMYVLI